MGTCAVSCNPYDPYTPWCREPRVSHLARKTGMALMDPASHERLSSRRASDSGAMRVLRRALFCVTAVLPHGGIRWPRAHAQGEECGVMPRKRSHLTFAPRQAHERSAEASCGGDGPCRRGPRFRVALLVHYRVHARTKQVVVCPPSPPVDLATSLVQATRTSKARLRLAETDPTRLLAL